MITAKQAHDLMIDSLQGELNVISEQITRSANSGKDSTVLYYISPQAQQVLTNAGYQVCYDDCERGTSFYAISWKNAN